MSALPATAGATIVRIETGQILGEKPPLVTPGTYELIYVYDETILLAAGRAPKLVLWFRIVTPGEFFGVKLPRYYNVRKLEGKPRRHGGFKVGWRSDFVRDFATLFGSTPPRANRIPTSKFEGVAIRGRVRTVTSTWKQKASPSALHYSVIDELLNPCAPTPSVTATPSPTASPTPTLKEAGHS